MILGEFSFLSSLYILVISPLSEVQLANIFSHSVGALFSLETISLPTGSFQLGYQLPWKGAGGTTFCAYNQIGTVGGFGQR
jgi:hypothetical protein